jgi:hypothetical protein
MHPVTKQAITAPKQMPGSVGNAGNFGNFIPLKYGLFRLRRIGDFHQTVLPVQFQ